MSNTRLIRSAAAVLLVGGVMIAAGASAQTSEPDPAAAPAVENLGEPAGGILSSSSLPGLSTVTDSLDNAMNDVRVYIVNPSLDYAGRSVQAVRSEAAAAWSSASNELSGGMGSVLNSAAQIPQWPRMATQRFIDRMNNREFENFSDLVDQSGFAISNVELGIGIIPNINVHFTHTRDISEAEFRALEDEIRDYTSELGPVSGYIETTILQGLLEAARQTRGARLKGVGVTLFPLPAVRLNFDPFDFSDRGPSQVVSAAELERIANQAEQRYLKDLEELEERLTRLIKQASDPAAADPSSAGGDASVEPARQ